MTNNAVMAALTAQHPAIFHPDWCHTCQSVVAEGQEHDATSHGSNLQYAEELMTWRAQLKATA